MVSGNKLPKISVVIPCYNSEKYIEKTLYSVFRQNYPNLEVIVQDGGSKDKTLLILYRFKKKYPKTLDIYSEKDKGQLDAINKGFKKASGDILTYINSDDIYTRNCFKTVSEKFLENRRSCWFAGEGIVIDSTGKEIYSFASFYKKLLLKLNKYPLLLIVNYLMQPSVFLTRKVFVKFGYFSGNQRYILEYDMWLKIGKKQMPIVLNKKLSKFRISGENITSKSFLSLLEDDLAVLKKHTNRKFIIFAHKLHNFFRILLMRLM